MAVLMGKPSIDWSGDSAFCAPSTLSDTPADSIIRQADLSLPLSLGVNAWL